MGDSRHKTPNISNLPPHAMPESEDHLSARCDEILALESIYPNELTLTPDSYFSGSVCIPVELPRPVSLVSVAREAQVLFLPPVEFVFRTGEKYPEEDPPEVSLQCTWLDESRTRQLSALTMGIWEDCRELCLFSMIDEISSLAQEVFGEEFIKVSEKVFDSIVEFSEQREEETFNLGVHFCGICLEDKKGPECFQLPHCKHVYCRVSPSTFAC
jgi:RWD domain